MDVMDSESVNVPSALTLLALTRLPKVGNYRAARLFHENFHQTDSVDYRKQFLGTASEYLSSADDGASIWNDCYDRLMACRDKGIDFMTVFDDDYPRRLRHIPDAPVVLFVKGDIQSLYASAAIAIIGTRKPTAFAEREARRSGQLAADRGVVVISGLALGCDTRAHEGCIEGQGIGIAVMAHGLDMVYPAANRGLADRLLESGGCLVSEYPPVTKPTRWAFAYRDRLQSGLSDGLLVVETSPSGGAMHTVKYARRQRRPVACIDQPQSLSRTIEALGGTKLVDDGTAIRIADQSDLYMYLDYIKSSQQHWINSGTSLTANQLAFDGIE